MLYLISFWEQLQYDGVFYGLLLFVVIAIVVVTWLYARTRSAHLLAQLKVQLLELQKEYHEQFFILDDECKARLEHLRLIMQDLQQQLDKGDSAMVLARRNELSNYLVLEYAKTVRQYSRMVEPFLRESRSRYLEFLENYILPFLQQSGDVLEIANQPKVLNLAGMGGSPLFLFYPDFDFAFDALRRYCNWWDFGLRRATTLHAKRLGFSKEL